MMTNHCGCHVLFLSLVSLSVWVQGSSDDANIVQFIDSPWDGPLPENCTRDEVEKISTRIWTGVDSDDLLELLLLCLFLSFISTCCLYGRLSSCKKTETEMLEETISPSEQEDQNLSISRGLVSSAVETDADEGAPIESGTDLCNEQIRQKREKEGGNSSAVDTDGNREEEETLAYENSSEEASISQENTRRCQVKCNGNSCLIGYIISVVGIWTMAYLLLYLKERETQPDICFFQADMNQIDNRTVPFSMMVSVRNSNNYDLRLDQGEGSFHYHGAEVGSFQIPSFMLEAKSITDIHLPGTFYPTKEFLQDFHNKSVVLIVGYEAVVHMDLWGFKNLFSRMQKKENNEIDMFGDGEGYCLCEPVKGTPFDDEKTSLEALSALDVALS